MRIGLGSNQAARGRAARAFERYGQLASYKAFEFLHTQLAHVRSTPV